MARKQIARALDPAWGVEVMFAKDGAEGLSMLRKARPALMLLDLTMPVMDGFDVLKAMAAEGLDIPVVVISGDIQPDARRRVKALGALEFIKNRSTASF
ncbi:response regulator [Alkalilimnicola ehrlichii]|uniref:response regulator n=1 Tax=Alkalilimnicola ehrlichii TaxID=351052 RepID=UPI002161F467|nr:response regulator [Alkalilimnicola ehrlichii]